MNTYKCLRALVIFLIIAGWIFSGWPRIWQKPAIPPEIQEVRAVAGDLILLWDGETLPTGWTCISCLSDDPYYNVYPRGAESYGTTTGGASTHSHTVSYVSCTAPSATAQYDNAGGADSYPSATHIHKTISSQTVTSASNDPLYRTLKIIKYSGMPSTLPNGIIGIFDTTSLPANWSAYSLQDTYFLKGSDTVATGGANTHTHDVTITTGGPDTTEKAKAGAKTGESATHTHTSAATASASADHQPPYLEVVFAQATADTSIPAGLIALFDAAPPANWTLVSGPDQPFNGRFLKGNSTAYGATGGASTHTHSNLDIDLPATGDTITTADIAPVEVGAKIAHTHTMTVSFSTESHLPVYRDTVFAKRDYIVTVGTEGSQTANLNIDQANQYVGGAFTFVRNAGSADVTSIIITEQGTVNANLNLSNVDLYYETAASCSYDGDETLFGTAATFNTSEKATVSGTMTVGTSQVCVYVVLDVGSGASAGETIEIEISNPSTEVTVSAGTVSPSTPVAIAGTTTLQAPSITCNYSTTTASLGTITSSAVNTQYGSTTINVTSNTTAFVKVYDAGDGTNPGLYYSGGPDLIGSADASYANQADLGTGGVEGYGAQVATSTDGSGEQFTVSSRFANLTGNNVGGFERQPAEFTMASTSAATTNRLIIITLKAGITGANLAGDYTDTITYTCATSL